MHTLYDIIILETKKVSSKIPLSTSLDIAKEIISSLHLIYINPFKMKPNYKGGYNLGIPVGSIRREEQYIRDIDILCTKKIKLDTIRMLPGFIRFISKGDKYISFDYKSIKNKIQREINIFICDDLKYFGAMLLHSTGPAEYNRNLRKIAKDQNLIANQYGVFTKDGKQIGGRTEESYYNTIPSSKYPKGKKWKHPKYRGKN